VLDPAVTTIDPRTTVGTVRLTVTDLPRARDFYERAIGLQALGRSGEALHLGAGGATLLELTGVRTHGPVRRRAPASSTWPSWSRAGCSSLAPSTGWRGRAGR
jgi:catechol 2,3-dioxygenase-like lactoylglutathione lyase family enzyme